VKTASSYDGISQVINSVQGDNMNHLKGPFGLQAALSSDLGNIRYIYADLGDGKPYAAIAAVHARNELTQEENLATAELLRLAPELRDALGAFVADIDGRFGEVPEDCDAYHVAVALLAKLPEITGDLSSCSLADLHKFTFVQMEDDIRAIADNYAGGNPDITGAVVLAKDGEFEKIWVTESARPFELCAAYTQIKGQ
jgi:hypothetical protein